MSNFKKTVLYIACVILIISLIVIGIMLANSKSKEAFPPLKGSCPDYWVEVEGDDKGEHRCINQRRLGDPKCDREMDFSTNKWMGIQGACNKQKWAKQCNLTWDGITNNNSVCKDIL